MPVSDQSGAWIDVSTPLTPDTLVWPGDDPVRVEQTMFLDRGESYNLTFLAMSAHSGTHVDAPRHFLPGGADVTAMPPGLMSGPARVIDIHHPGAVHADELPLDLQPGERILLRTRNSRDLATCPHFREDFVYVAHDAARLLAIAGVSLVGIDYLSIGGFSHDLVETHQVLLSAGIWIVEGLRLENVQPGLYEFLCLPLLIPGADGAPARALLRPLARNSG